MRGSTGKGSTPTHGAAKAKFNSLFTSGPVSREIIPREFSAELGHAGAGAALDPRVTRGALGIDRGPRESAADAPGTRSFDLPLRCVRSGGVIAAASPLAIIRG